MFLRVYALISIVAKRILAQPWLTLAALLGLVLSSALAISIPLYADATYHRIFQQNLDENGSVGTSRRPPMVLLFHFPAASGEPAEWNELESLDSYLSGSTTISTLGLPRRHHIRYVRTAEIPLFIQGETHFSSSNRLLSVRFGFMSGLADHITLTEGTFPIHSTDLNEPIGVLISEPFAELVGFQIGEIYILFAENEEGDGQAIPIRIAGIWLPTDPASEYWFTPMDTVQQSFFISEQDYQNKLAPAIEDEVSLAFWYSIFDDSSITYEDAQPLINAISRIERRAMSIREGVRLSSSPASVMQRYQRDARLLTLTLQVMSIPIVGLLLTFISLVARLIIEGRRNEIAVLRSRGASRAQIISLSIIEVLILGSLGLAIAIPLGIVIANVMGKTESFLSFALDTGSLRTQITRSAVIFGVAAVIISALAQLWPTMGASRYTILSYKRERARLQNNPWWQRAWLDLILLVASAYGYSLLRREGGITTSAAVENPANQFQDPLLYLLPVLVILALTMVFLRIMPILLNGAAWLLARTRSVSLLMAVRHVARTPSAYSIPLTLLILTLSLSIFTASMADSLDRHLVDQTYYQYGADVVFSERGENRSLISAFVPASASSEEDSSWVFLPVSDYLAKPGVEAVTRVGTYPALARLGADRVTGIFYGIDRMSFAQAAYWRSDFALTSLGDLMNRLAQYPDGVLVSNDFMRGNGARLGDLISLNVNAYGDSHNVDYRIIGTFDLFPGWYPEDQALFVGNLEYFFEQAGSQYPYRVWVRANRDADPASLAQELAPMTTIGRDVPQENIAQAQASPRRQGMFGILSVGYSSAVILTVIGFLMYALFSFRQRFVELGMMRAIGLSTSQMGGLLAWELALLIIMGSLLGTILGIGISHLFVPFMKVSGADILNIPPYQVHIAWLSILRIYAIFGLLFAIELTILVMLLRRMRISQAIKLGETI